MKKNLSSYYFPELDVIKAMAIIMVIAFHFFGQVSDWHMRVVQSSWFFEYWQTFDMLRLLKFLEGYLYLGVNLFVIASGFGLALSYFKGKKKFEWKEFFWKRLVRLLPGAFIGTLIVFLIKGFFLDSWPLYNWYLNFFPFLAGLNLFSDRWFFPPINGETWFLGLVLQLYLLFPFLLRFLKKVGAKKFLIVLFIISVGFRTLYYLYFQETVPSLTYGLSIGRLFEFGFGIVLASMASKRQNLSPWWMLGILLFWGYFFSFSFPFADLFMGVALFTFLWFLAKKVGHFHLFKKLSDQSYLIFLTHHPLIWILNKWGINDVWNLRGFGIFIILCFSSYFLAKFCNLLFEGITSLFKRNTA